VLKVLHYWPEEEKRLIARAILETGSQLGEFTADDVHLLFPEVEQCRRNCLPAMFSALHKMGFIQATGNIETSKRNPRHGGAQRIWRLNCDYNDKLRGKDDA
jgi:hypothetical protein